MSDLTAAADFGGVGQPIAGGEEARCQVAATLPAMGFCWVLTVFSQHMGAGSDGD